MGIRWRSETPFRRETGTPAGHPEPPAALALDHVRGLPKLIEEFDTHQEVDTATQNISMLLGVTGALKAAARQRGLQVRTLVDNTFIHRPMELTDEERARVHAAFKAVRRQHEPESPSTD